MMIGHASDADVYLEGESVLDHHARIEHKPDGYYLISLDNTGGVLVNGAEITFQQLNHGDRLEIGDAKAVLLLSDEDAPAHEAPLHGEPVREAMPLAMATTMSPMTMAHQARCPHCGMPVTPMMPSCPHCGLPLSNLPSIPMGFVPPTPMSQAGPGILPIIAFLAALTGVGAPVALVLGLMTLSIIRRRGGTVRDRSLAKWSIGLGLMWIMLGTVAAGGVVKHIQKRKQLNAVEVYESKVIRALKNLACAQKYAHTIECFDADADGHGEYGTLPVLPETKSPFFDTDLADGEAYGYWFTIREASEGQFLAVAEPTRYGETGIRTFVIDQAGKIRGGDTEGIRFGQVTSVLPILQGERNAYYEIDDEIAKDVLNYVKSLSLDLTDQEKIQRILRRLREEYALTTVGRKLDGMEPSVDRFVSEQHAQAIYLEAKNALANENRNVALAKLIEIQEKHPSFSEIAAVERELSDLRSMIAQHREQDAQDLFSQAEEIERQGKQPQEVQRLYQRIEKLYPDTDVAVRIASLKPELQRQLREHNAENIFSDLMELSPERDFEEILNRINQLRRNYKDTDLFSKTQIELTEKERKARASSWRTKTEQNMAAGRMRGALAQLESAARENPDLLYDLRDLCIQLYRSVADTLIEEGDARKALTYYKRLGQLLQAAGSEEKVDPDLLAKLHNDVGQADFGIGEYAEARWHLASAAWKYQDNAQFNMRLGAANLYLGLYQPAKIALNCALNIRTNMTSALLYRSYLNLRSTFKMEQVLADSFKQSDAEPTPKATNSTPASPQSAPEPVVINMADSDNMDSTELENAIRNASPQEKIEIKGPKSLNLKPSDANRDWFSRFEGAPDKDSAVPGPKDLDLFLGFDYQSSSEILPGFMQFLEDLHQQRAENFTAKQDASVKSINPKARAAAHSQMMTEIQRTMTEYRSQIRELRKAHFEDVASRKELYNMMDDIKQRLRDATDDLQSAARQTPQIQSLTEHVLSQINAKHKLLDEAAALISSTMEKEIDMREDIIDLVEDVLERDQMTSSEETSLERTFSRLKKKLFDEGNIVNIDQALRSLRSSMNVHVDLNDILRAAGGNE